MIEHYELLAIFPGTQTEEEVQTSVQKLNELLVQHGAAITLHEFWGKRKLAYEIKHIRHGYYDLTEFDMESTKLQTLDSALRLHEALLRHQVVRKIVKTPEVLAAEAALRERIAAKRQAIREKEQAVAVSADAPVMESVDAAEPAAPVAKEKLEEKLEQMLDSDKIDI